MGRIAEEYGTLVFNDHTMQELLPSATYKALAKTIKEGKPLDIDVANVVAHAMKEWAVAHGATHYTHWFQPLSGITSEKHDAFLDPRQDLILTGRTLFGAPPCKGQKMEEHYFGAIRPTVNNFMKELDEELWKLGVAAKTKHNEVAPCQHELAPMFTISNVAIDHNLLTMELMRTIASHYGLVCLQHEKPFEGINGSGKHNNWSIATDRENLLDPGKTPASNLRFLVFLAAVVQAVDDHQDLLRISVASAGNDHRLGANEAPPAVISIFLGDELGRVVDAIIAGKPDDGAEAVYMDLGVEVLPNFERDNTDRNRTSPFAFTGNKFEFRMPGSQVNLSDANTILNTIVAKSLKNFCEAVEGANDFEKAAYRWVRTALTDHQRIIFNGDGYADEWIEEAESRGLLNLKSLVDAAPHMLDQKNIDLFAEFGVLSEAENHSRYEVKLETYSKLINIEGQTMSHMAKRKIAPAVSAYAEHVAGTVNAKKAANPDLQPVADQKLLAKLNDGANEISEALDVLDAALAKAQGTDEPLAKARTYHDEVLAAMESLRAACDVMEGIVSTEAWPLPTYNKMLFYC